MNILISGGGIAGLTTYIALTKQGHNVSIIEKRDSFTPNGSGLILAMNAMLMFKKLGLQEEVIAHSRELKGLRMTNEKGKSLSFTFLQSLKLKYKTQAVTIKRASLHKILENHIDFSKVRFSTQIRSIEASEQGKEVTFDDGSSQTYELIIIAEGLHSTTRALLLGANPYRFSGYTCWRAIVDVTFNHELIEMWGNQSRFGIVPLSETQTYIYLTYNAEQNDEKLKSLTARDIKELFSSYGGKAPNVLNAIDENTLFYHDDLIDYATLTFSKDGILFVGDSAHAMTPNMGQGATMGIEDGVILSELIQRYPNEYVKHYNSVRKQRVAKIHKLSYLIGKMAQVKNPILRNIIHLIMRLTPDDRMKKQVEDGLIKPIL